MTAGEAQEPVRVVIRVRPETEPLARSTREGVSPGRICVVTHSDNRVSLLSSEESSSRALGHSQPTPRSQLAASFSSSLGSSTLQSGRSYAFDRAFGPYSTQQDVYEAARPLIESVIRGYNATVLAYGVTGSGKTYTMMGNHKHPGVIPRAVADIFSMIQKATEARGEQESMFLVWLTYVELYNNKFRNLLDGTTTRRPHTAASSPSSSLGSTAAAHVSNASAAASRSGKIEVRESKVAGVFLAGPNLRHSVTSADEALELIAAGDRHRSVGSTACNAHSSRSHAVLTFHVESRVALGGHSEIRVGKLNLVDLAGSERVGLSGAEGDTLVETQNINLSLTTLANVLSALSRNALQHPPAAGPQGMMSGEESVLSASEASQQPGSTRGPAPVPYRDSKLTYLLKDSLGGNSKTLMITTLRATEEYYKQTQMSLMYAARAKNIKNRTVINFDVVGESGINRVSSEIETLKRRLRDRAAELDRLCCGEGEEDRGHLLRKLEELGQANAREKKELEEQLSKIILNQAGQLASQRQDFSSLQHRLHHELARYRHTCALQEKEISSLRDTLEALRRTRLCSGASEDEVAEMQKVLEAWQSQARATQQELIHASQQLRVLHGERASDKQAMDELRRQLEASRASEKALAAEVSSLRTAVDDEKERAAQLSSAEAEVGRLRMRLDRLEADLLEKQQAMEDMRASDRLAESREVASLKERLHRAEEERHGMESEARRAREERDEAVRVHRLMLEAADLADRTSEDVEREIMEVKVEVGRKEAQLAWLKDELRGLDEQIAEAQARRDHMQTSLPPLSAASSVADRSAASSALAATEREQALQEDLHKTRSDLDETRRAYKALESKFSVSVIDLEARFRVVIEEKEARIRTAEALQRQAEDAYARLQVRLASFQAQLESAKEEAEQVVREGSQAADTWRQKARELEAKLGQAGSKVQDLSQALADSNDRIKGLEAEVEQARVEVQRWKEAAGQKAVALQRGAEEALRRKEAEHDRERRVLDGALKAARAREVESVRMAMEDRDAAVRRALERADGVAFELRAEVQSRADQAVEQHRQHATRLEERLEETGNQLSRAQAARGALQEALDELQREAVEAEARFTERELEWKEKIGALEVLREQDERQARSAVWEALASKDRELEDAALEAQRLAVAGAAKVREELKGMYEGLMATASKEHDEAMEVLRAELRGARAEAKRLEEDGKDGEAELLRLRRRIAALEEERDQERRRWDREREGLLKGFEAERVDLTRRCEEESEQRVQSFAEVNRLRKARERELRARVAEIEGLFGGLGASADYSDTAKEHWADRLRRRILAMQSRHEADMNDAAQDLARATRQVQGFLQWVGSEAEKAGAGPYGRLEDESVVELLDAARARVADLVAARRRAVELVRAQEERAAMAQEEARQRERQAEERWAGRLEEAVASTRAQAAVELEALTSSMQVTLEQAREVVDKARVERDECEAATAKRWEARMREELARQGESLRTAMERAVQEREKQHAERLRQAEAEVRREERASLTKSEHEWRVAVDAVRADADRRVQAVEAKARARLAEALEEKEAQTKALLDRLAEEREQAVREALVESERAWATESHAQEKAWREQVRALVAEAKLRTDEDWQAKLAERLSQKDRWYEDKLGEVRAEAEAREAGARAKLERAHAEKEAALQKESAAKERLKAMEEQAARAVAEAERRCRAEALGVVDDKERAWEGVVADLRREADQLRIREEGWRGRAEALGRELEEERRSGSKEREELKRRAEEEQRRAREMDARRAAELETLRASITTAAAAEAAERIRAAVKAREAELERVSDAVWTARLREAREKAEEEGRSRAEARAREELEAVREAMEWRVREAEEEGRRRVTAARAQQEERIEQAVRLERQRWEGMAWRARVAAVQGWREGARSSGHGAEAEAESMEKWVASVGQRHRLVARKIKRQAVEKGLLMVAGLVQSKGHARLRAAWLSWRTTAGFRLVDLRKLQAQGAQVTARLQRLRRERRGLRLEVEQTARTLRRDMEAITAALQARPVAAPLPDQHVPRRPLASEAAAPAPVHRHRQYEPPLPAVGVPTSSRPQDAILEQDAMKARANPPPASLGEAPPSRESVESALLEGDSDRLAQLWPRWAAQERRQYSSILPWHTAVRGSQFHASVPRLMGVWRLLASLRVDPGQQDASGDTALHCCLKLGPPAALPALIREVLTAGAKPDVRNKEGDTALHVAVRLAEGGRVCPEVVAAVVQALADGGADPNAARLTPPFDTPLSLALAAAADVIKGGGKAVRKRRARRGRPAEEKGPAEGAVRMVTALVEAKYGASWDPQWRAADGSCQAQYIADMCPPASDPTACSLYRRLCGLARAAGLQVPVEPEADQVMTAPLSE